MALAVINKCSAIINRLPAIIMVAIIDMALAIIDMASAIVNMLTVIHAMATAININIDINTRRFCFFPPSGTGPAAGSGILGSGSLSAGICAKTLRSSRGINVCVSRCRASRPTLVPCSCVNFWWHISSASTAFAAALSTSCVRLLRVNGSNVQPKLCSMQLAI